MKSACHVISALDHWLGIKFELMGTPKHFRIIQLLCNFVISLTLSLALLTHNITGDLKPVFLFVGATSISHNPRFLPTVSKRDSSFLYSRTPPSQYSEDQVSQALQLSPADDRPVGSLVWCWKQIPVPLYELCIAGMCRKGMSMLWCLSDPLHKKLETAYAFEMSRGLPYRPFSRAPSASSVVLIRFCAANLDRRLRLYIVFISLVIMALDENKREPLDLIFCPDSISAQRLLVVCTTRI